jgi:hypothetical protein
MKRDETGPFVLRHLPIWTAQIRRYVVSQSGAQTRKNGRKEREKGESILRRLPRWEPVASNDWLKYPPRRVPNNRQTCTRFPPRIADGSTREKAENGMGNGAKSGSLSMSILLVDRSWDVHFQVGFWRENRWRARFLQTLIIAGGSRGHARRSWLRWSP